MILRMVDFVVICSPLGLIKMYPLFLVTIFVTLLFITAGILNAAIIYFCCDFECYDFECCDYDCVAILNFLRLIDGSRKIHSRIDFGLRDCLEFVNNIGPKENNRCHCLMTDHSFLTLYFNSYCSYSEIKNLICSLNLN
jgi:hypothetical protein